MLQTEVKSVATTGTDLTMITLMREEMVVNRKEANGSDEAHAIPISNVSRHDGLNDTKNKSNNRIRLSIQPIRIIQCRHPSHPNYPPRSQHTSPRQSIQKEILYESNTTSPQRMTQATDLTKTPPAELLTQPTLPTEIGELMHHQEAPHIKPVSTGATPPPKKSRNTPQSNESNRKLNDEFDDVQSFPKSADSQGAAGGGL
jgi:hypothetical protein